MAAFRLSRRGKARSFLRRFRGHPERRGTGETPVRDTPERGVSDQKDINWLAKK